MTVVGILTWVHTAHEKLSDAELVMAGCTEEQWKRCGWLGTDHKQIGEDAAGERTRKSEGILIGECLFHL
jgi:hypothetical protein